MWVFVCMRSHEITAHMFGKRSDVEDVAEPKRLDMRMKGSSGGDKQERQSFEDD